MYPPSALQHHKGAGTTKGKEKAQGSKNLVDTLFALTQLYAADEERQNDPLVLSSNPTYSSNDAYFRKAGISKKDKVSVRFLLPVPVLDELTMSAR